MRHSSGNRGLVPGALQIGADCFVPDGAGEIGPAVENRVGGKDRLGIMRGAGIGAWRVAAIKL
jgi:hypothetical protein